MIQVCYNKSMKVTCSNCSIEYNNYPSYIKMSKNNYCSRECWRNSKIGKPLPLHNIINNKGENNPNWKGGKRYFQGYVLVKQTDGSYIREHRLVMEKYLGRKLNNNEVVHHKNNIRHDNRIENLEVLTSSEHQIIHHPKLFKKCQVCGISKGKVGTKELCFNCYQRKRYHERKKEL